MTKPKRPSMAAAIEAEANAAALSRDNAATESVESSSLVTPSRDDAELSDSGLPKEIILSRDNAVTSDIKLTEKTRLVPEDDASVGRGNGKRRSPGDKTRHTYHASLYLPDEAQFALREIALTMRRAKPHDVMLEAMADLFERYNKGQLAEECRQRITSRDKAKA